jgi:predicted acylesterase/phospholipase RssA
MYDALAAPRRAPFGDPTSSLFRLGLSEFWRRSREAPRVVAEAARLALRGEGRNLGDLVWSLFELLPAGMLDNSGLEEYLARLFAARGKSNRFDELPKPLHVIAVDLDSGEAVDFGAEGGEVPVSKAVQASTALPGLFRPVRIDGRDYVDGGVKKTAHINLAIRNGADLVICINPIVPLDNRGGGALSSHLAGKGVTYVLDQVLRIALHGRMQYGLERYKTEHPEVDILLLEPTRDDLRMFSYHIMRYSARRIVAAHAYRSTLETFTTREREYARLLARHGIRLRDPRAIPRTPEVGRARSMVARALSGSLDALSSALRRKAG